MPGILVPPQDGNADEGTKARVGRTRPLRLVGQPGQVLAGHVNDAIVAALKFPDRGLKYRDNLHVLNATNDQSFYLFQLPGMHGLLRPEIKLEDGRCLEQQKPAQDGNRVGALGERSG